MLSGDDIPEYVSSPPYVSSLPSLESSSESPPVSELSSPEFELELELESLSSSLSLSSEAVEEAVEVDFEAVAVLVDVFELLLLDAELLLSSELSTTVVPSEMTSPPSSSYCREGS